MRRTPSKRRRGDSIPILTDHSARLQASCEALSTPTRARGLEQRASDESPHGAPVVVVGWQREAFDTVRPLLEAADYQILTAGSAAEAVDLVARERPCFLIIDSTALDANGAALIRRLQALDPGAVVIAQCESLDAAQRRRVRRSLGLYGIYDKADDPERLLELLDAAAEASRRIDHVRAEGALGKVILAKLCHDLRSYVHVIGGYTEVLCNDPTTTPCETVLSRLASATDIVRELVQAYLDLAHLESTPVIIHRELVDIDGLTAGLRVQAERQRGTRPSRVVVTVPAHGAVVHTDGEQLRAVLAQLLSNAIKLSDDGMVELTARFGKERTDFAITSTARGPAENVSPEPLQSQQLTDESLGGTPGQGLGLAIARRLSQLLGATLTADRSTDGAIVFTLSLPVGALVEAEAPMPTLH